jgi:hypothetical protein
MGELRIAVELIEEIGPRAGSITNTQACAKMRICRRIKESRKILRRGK